MENWKNIVGYEGLYQVSDQGRVKSLDRVVVRSDGKVMNYKSRIMKPAIDKKGYKRVALSKENKLSTYKVHRLVAQHFLGNSELIVDHIDHDRSNNNLSNLRYVNARENSSHRKDKGSSEYIGVSWDKFTNSWKSSIQVQGKLKHLGRFDTELEASQAYQKELATL